MTHTKVEEISNTSTFVLEISKLDSVRIRIPAEKITDRGVINIPYLRLTKEGEIIGTHKTDNSLEITSEGASIRLGYTPSVMTDKGVHEEAYSLTLSAKMLGKDYGTGINRENLKQIWEWTQRVPDGLKFEYEDFAQAKWSGAEYAIDFTSTLQEYNDLIQIIEDKLKQWVRADGYWNRFQGKKIQFNLGFELNSRGGATPKKLYNHMYNKEEEMKSEKNRILADAIGTIPSGLRRFETNFKNNKFLLANGLPKCETLEELINLPELSVRQIMLSNMKNYTMNEKPTIESGEGDKWYEAILIEAIAKLGLEKDKSSDHVIWELQRDWELKNNPTKRQKQATRQGLEKLSKSGKLRLEEKRKVRQKAIELAAYFGIK